MLQQHPALRHGRHARPTAWAKRIADLCTAPGERYAHARTGYQRPARPVFPRRRRAARARTWGPRPTAAAPATPISHSADPDPGLHAGRHRRAHRQGQCRGGGAAGLGQLGAAADGRRHAPGQGRRRHRGDRGLSSRPTTRMGGTLVNINVISKEQILEAHADPAKYPDLVVRVTGYSAYFKSLSPRTASRSWIACWRKGRPENWELRHPEIRAAVRDQRQWLQRRVGFDRALWQRPGCVVLQYPRGQQATLRRCPHRRAVRRERAVADRPLLELHRALGVIRVEPQRIVPRRGRDTPPSRCAAERCARAPLARPPAGVHQRAALDRDAVVRAPLSPRRPSAGAASPCLRRPTRARRGGRLRAPPLGRAVAHAHGGARRPSRARARRSGKRRRPRGSHSMRIVSPKG